MPPTGDTLIQAVDSLLPLPPGAWREVLRELSHFSHFRRTGLEQRQNEHSQPGPVKGLGHQRGDRHLWGTLGASSPTGTLQTGRENCPDPCERPQGPGQEGLSAQLGGLSDAAVLAVTASATHRSSSIRQWDRDCTPDSSWQLSVPGQSAGLLLTAVHQGVRLAKLSLAGSGLSLNLCSLGRPWEAKREFRLRAQMSRSPGG